VWNSAFSFENANAANWHNISLAEAGGHAAVSWLDSSAATHAVRYRRSGASLASWPASIPVAQSNSIGTAGNLTIVNGRPAICWLDGSILRYARAADANGDTWQPAVTIVGSNASAPLCMAVINGNPAVTYASGTSAMRYIRATDADGAAWPATSVLVSSTVIYSPTLLTDSSGHACVGGATDESIVMAAGGDGDLTFSTWTLFQRGESDSVPLAFVRAQFPADTSMRCVYWQFNAGNSATSLPWARPLALSGTADWIAVEK